MDTPFREFNIDDFEAIQKDLVPYVVSAYPGRTTFWNHIDQTLLFKNVPKLLDGIAEIVGQIPLKTYLLVVPNATDEILNQKLGSNSLHKDTSAESCRLNWPVLNSTSIETKFFNSDAEPRQLTLPTGEIYFTYRENDCRLIGSFLMSKPSVLHVHTIHGLYRAPGPLPRYILSFNFKNPIDHLLNPI